MKTIVLALALACLPATLLGQHSRVTFNGTPANLRADLASVAFAPHPTVSNGFYVLMPLSDVVGGTGGPFIWDSVFGMNAQFGPAAWTRCTMRAEEWSYFSTNRCLHRPAMGGSAPESLLTSDFDYGPYPSVAGTPDRVLPGWTRFSGAGVSQAVVAGNISGFSIPYTERWQLRVRGYSSLDLWNACPGGSITAPPGTGWIAVYFTVTFP